MKRKLLAIALMGIAGVANAGLSFNELATVTRTEEFKILGSGLPTFAVGTSLKVGSLEYTAGANGAQVIYTYLGQESGFTDVFFNLGTPSNVLLESYVPGTSVVANYGAPNPIASPLSFKFEGANGKFAVNGGAWDSGTSIGLIGTNMTINSQTFAYVIGYNDSAGDAYLGDWDDFVIGVNIAPIPEPETYAMLLAGLGLMGFVARRRKKSATV